MRKIPRLFLPSGQEDGTCGQEVDPQCLWVFKCGRATRKFDGTCCMVRNRVLYARRQVKWSFSKHGPLTLEGLQKKAPPDFEPFYIGHGRVYGWVPALTAENCKKHRLYLQQARGIASWYEDGTYELVGPGVNGNPDGFTTLQLVRHGAYEVDFDATYYTYVSNLYYALKTFLTEHPFEGIVFHGPSGLYAKICRQHFGLEWPVK